MNKKETYKDRLNSMGHRHYVGGEDVESWYKIGRMQYHYLVTKGLNSNHIFLDVACGSLRLGQYLIPMLDSGNYYGLDGNPDLIKLGVENELDFDIFKDKSPKFESNYDFDFSFSPQFDFAIAQSLFTHLTLKDIELCFKNISSKMHKDSKFYFTFFEGNPANNPIVDSDPHKGWFYSQAELKELAKKCGLDFHYIGDWKHPRNQKIACAMIK